MAKINHNNSLETIDQLFTNAKNHGAMHLISDKESCTDKTLKIDGNDLKNFGTCGYLGLELDDRLKKGSIDFALKYGTQFSVSRAFVSAGNIEYLEDLLSKMYDGSPVITYSSTSTAHISVIPSLVSYKDAIILDQQVHMSVQTAVQLMRKKNVPIEMIRHNNIEMLKRMVEKLYAKHDKVWYMIDGVYSMFGDVAPMEEILVVMEQFKNLYIYVDDAHGMGWYGKNGTGYVWEKAYKHPRMILTNTLAKGFGVMGGFTVFPNDETKRKVRIFGGPLSYSHQLSPPLVGAAIESAKIHLSDEIIKLQKELQILIDYCNKLLSSTDLIVASNPTTPIFLIGMGQPKIAYKMVKRVINDGYFVNPAIFPAVPIKNTGLRFTINRHIDKDSIKGLISSIHHNLPIVLKEEGVSFEKMKRNFLSKSSSNNISNEFKDLSVTIYNDINEINKSSWDYFFNGRGTFNWAGLKSIQEVYTGNIKEEDNAKFYYIFIKDQQGETILATFFTLALQKDDFLSLESKSEKIEVIRKKDPYYLTSKSLLMGSMLSEGAHCYINKTHEFWKQAVKLMLNKVDQIKTQTKANAVLLRDFKQDDLDLKTIFVSEGYLPIKMPNSNDIEDLQWDEINDLPNGISSKSRAHIRKEVLKSLHLFNVEFKNKMTKEEKKIAYKLYLNLHHKNLGINMFPYPEKILEVLDKSTDWEFMVITLKEKKQIVAIGWNHISKDVYSPLVLGVDYINTDLNIYKHVIYNAVKRAHKLKVNKVKLGYSADFEKKKYGAKNNENNAYMLITDSFNMDVIENIN